MENKENFEIDEFTKSSINTEWVESPYSIDLRSCIRGDELKSRDGSIMYYVQPLPNSIYEHEISYDKERTRLGSRTNIGRVLKCEETGGDIIEIIRQ